MRFYDLTEMKRRLAELDAEREPLVSLIAAAEAYEKNSQGRNKVSTPAPQRNSSVQHGKTVQQITEDTALERIETTGMPVQTRTVIEIMRERHLPLPNKNLINVVSARLSNSRRLEGRRGLGWWPKGRPWPDDQSSDDFLSGVDTFRHHNESGEADASPDAEGAATPSNETP